MKQMICAWAVAAGMVALCPVSQADTLNWDGGGGDGLLSTANNWDPNQAPASGDILNIGTGDTVAHENNLPGGVAINLTGTSTLSNVTSVIRLNSANISVEAGSRLTGAFWDLDRADLTFEDGAIADMASWEQKGSNTFTFVLGSSGFSTLTPDRLYVDNNNTSQTLEEKLAKATYIVDMTNYISGTGLVGLVDFSLDTVGVNASSFQSATLIVTNAGVYSNAAIRWDESSSAIQLGPFGAAFAWDGEAGDGVWRNPTNWIYNVLPGVGDTASIANGDTVVWDTTAGSGNLPTNLIVNISGSSTLKASEPLRLNGATINVESNCTLTSEAGTFFDFINGTVNFADGAIVTMSDWEQKGGNTFTFELSADGFTPLRPRNLRLGAGATMSNATYIVDMTNYTGSAAAIVLVDFSNNVAGVTEESFRYSTRIVSNAGIYSNATIQWNDDDNTIELIPTGQLFVWDGGGSDDSWTTAENWDLDLAPGPADDVVIGPGYSVTNGQQEFTSLAIGEGATVLMSEYTTAGNTIICSGTLGYPGVFRLLGAPTVALTGTGRFGASIMWLDTQGATIGFEDGASIGNPTMNFEQRHSNTFHFVLSEKGFTALELGRLRSGDKAPGVPSTWSDVTYDIDIAAYNRNRGTQIVLMDFTEHDAIYDDPFDATVNITGLDGGLLSFAPAESRLVLTVIKWGPILVVR